ncbi:uncharacterized protein LOC125241499 [Leguminivora glycinivorella]|uniref:uncharacterized protein LOC125241499 n=1 Tax=Leguminivora glycinivorella TaxID=1035111 RepID=UPI00200E165F|nr:uncharacterized protein LOC125241499 [Leguminivora glycinivorella]
MASNRHATPLINHNTFICVLVSLLLPSAPESAARTFDDSRRMLNEDGGRRLTREYDLRQGALRGIIVRPSRQYDLQSVEMFLGIPYAAPPVGNFRFMPPASAPSWSGVKMATRFAPVCPQSLPAKKKDDPQSLGRQRYMERLEPFLAHESEDCLYLNIYVPYREQKPKKFPVLVFIHGDSFEWSTGNAYDGRILASYGNIMVITINYRLGILGFLKPSMSEYVYNNNGLLDQLAALQWIKDNIEDLNGDPSSVTLMGHGTGAACVSFLMLSPISNGLFHRAILMSGSALSDRALTKDPTQYTLQVAQSLGCNPTSKQLMTCLQNKPLSEIKKIQILAREFETPLGPVVAGSFIPDKPFKIMASYPNLLSKYQLLSGVTEYETYHDFGAIELEHGILETQRDEFITKYIKLIFEGADDVPIKYILKQYAPSKLDPQRWSVETNRDVILNLFSDARTLSPLVSFANYHSKANSQSYFYVFGHNSISTHYAALNKSVHGEELPYVLGAPLGGANTHFHSEYTPKEKLLSEAIMRLWTNFVKIGTPNTQSVNEYFTLDRRQWDQYNVEWPEYNEEHKSYLRLDIPPLVSSFYRSRYTKFWIDTFPNNMTKFVRDPLYEFTPIPTTQKPKVVNKAQDPIRRIWTPTIVDTPRVNPPMYGRVKPYSPPVYSPNTDAIYDEIQSIKSLSRPTAPKIIEKNTVYSSTLKPKILNDVQVKTSTSTITLIVSLGILFLAVNVGICTVLFFKKRNINLRENMTQLNRRTRANMGEVDIIPQKNLKDDKNALQTLKTGCSVIKSMSLSKMRSNNTVKNKQESCKTPKSDDSGGFRERFQLRRHLSTSTLDAHTKVRDWIANEVMHRCSPKIMRKSNTEISPNNSSAAPNIFTRSEELLPNSKTLHIIADFDRKGSIRHNATYDKNSSSKFSSSSSISSQKKSITSSIRNTAKSTDSMKSKGTESSASKKVSVAIDATPTARTNSILQQEPIELRKSFTDQKHSENENKDTKIKFTNEVTLSIDKDKSPLKISHKHSTSDPVTDMNYDVIFKNTTKSDNGLDDILPPVTFRNDVNVTSRSENVEVEPLSTSEALLTIKRRNFPKVLPDLPRLQKRFSLQPTALQTFRHHENNIESDSDHLKVPPQPPPRTTTLDRRLAYKHTKPLSSFESSDAGRNLKLNNYFINYENIEDLLTRKPSAYKCGEPVVTSQNREYPKVIIASDDAINISMSDFIQASPSSTMSSNVPRVRLPDNFHTSNDYSLASFSSICSDDDIDIMECDFTDDLGEDKLIQELVGGVESPINSEDMLDSKGPATIYEKKMEIVPVKVNTYTVPKSKENYVCITDLQLPHDSCIEKTAQIKPNYGINKLQQRSESIHAPPEKAVKVIQKSFIRPSTILNRSLKSTISNDKADKNKLEHSNSGSSNDTEASTGTVKKMDIQK